MDSAQSDGGYMSEGVSPPLGKRTRADALNDTACTSIPSLIFPGNNYPPGIAEDDRDEDEYGHYNESARFNIEALEKQLSEIKIGKNKVDWPAFAHGKSYEELFLIPFLRDKSKAKKEEMPKEPSDHKNEWLAFQYLVSPWLKLIREQSPELKAENMNSLMGYLYTVYKKKEELNALNVTSAMSAIQSWTQPLSNGLYVGSGWEHILGEFSNGKNAINFLSFAQYKANKEALPRTDTKVDERARMINNTIVTPKK